jgi:general nucleoside transport system permease protein
MTIVEAILLTVATAATPLILAAIGELVVERAGVLNLGVEGMMAVGAACAFGGAVMFDSTVAGVVCGSIGAALLATLFAFAVLVLAANQVASGLALTILGLGVAGLIGAPFVGARREPVAHLFVPGLTDLPIVGRLVFGEDAFVYGSAALVVAVAWFLSTRPGLTLRAVGENHASAHSLGLPVLKVRWLAILFGGACAGLAGAYLSLVYTRFWSPGMTAGRGWIALALVVFASWRPGRALAGAYLFGLASVLQLHAQAGSIGLPSQFLSALPYLVTIIALVLLSLRDRRAMGAPGSLGTPFVPDR